MATQGRHAGLVARLPRFELVVSEDCDLSSAPTFEAAMLPTPGGEYVRVAEVMAALALAALPPPADPPISADVINALKGLKAEVNAVIGLAEPDILEAIGRTNLSVLKHWRDKATVALDALDSRPADPPALVALVREIGHIRARTLEATCPDCDGPACDHGKAYDPISQIVAKALAASAVDLVAVENAEAELLAYPLPAAPPAPEPQAMPPIEVGDVARLDGFGLVTVNRPEEAGVLSLGIDGLVAVYKPVWTREPRR